MFALRWDDFGKRWEATCEVCGQEAHSPAFTYGVQGVDFLNNLWVHREVCQGGATVRLIPKAPQYVTTAIDKAGEVTIRRSEYIEPNSDLRDQPNRENK